MATDSSSNQVEEDLQPMERLMRGPLVAWVKTFRDKDNGSLDYSRLVDGAFLSSVLSRIDPRTGGRIGGGGHIKPAEDAYGRIRNFDALVRAVKTFYEDVLGQLVLVRLPDPVSLGKEPDSENGLAGMERLLLLVLGCAVQGPSKEEVIEDIKRLPLATQHAIVECIQQVADNPNCVWNKEWSTADLRAVTGLPGWTNNEGEDENGDGQQEELYRILVQHLRRLVQERDDYAQQLTALVLKEIQRSSSSSSSSSSGSNNENNGGGNGSGVLVELAEAKAKLRRCRQELEEKCEQVAELRDELDTLHNQSARVKQENMDLVQEARLSKALRDELDIVRERASKVDRLEAELNRYKDKLNDIDYYKARLEELREDNRLLEETKTILEGQLDSARQRAELVLDLEGELLNLKGQLAGLLAEKEADKERLKKLAEENAHWQLCTKNCLSESASLTAELESLRAHNAAASSGINKDLGEQMSSMDLLGKARRLELENQRLAALLSSNSAKESGLLGGSGERIVQLEGECARLKQKLADLEEERRTKDAQVADLMDSVNTKASQMDKERGELQRTALEQKNVIDTLKVDRCKMDELELQVATLSGENQKLQRSVELFQRRAESIQSESKDLESENGKLHKTVESLRHSLRRLNDLEKENTDLESENHRLDRESKGLHKEIARLKQAIEVKDESLDEYSAKLSTVEREWKRLQKEVEALTAQGSKLRDLERDNKELQQAAVVEHRTLAAIREELVQEKIRCQQLHCQLDTNSRTLDHARTELAQVKHTNEELVQKVKAATTAASSTSPSSKSSGKESGHNNSSSSLPPTLELGREVLAVKDRLVQLERQNAVLLAEKDNLNAQVQSYKERVNESAAQLAAVSQQLATLQVENSTLASQLGSVTAQSATLQAALSGNESEKEKLAARLQSSEARLERVSRDQQDLQKLHEQLQREYDALLAEREQLKTSQRESKNELRSLQDQLAASLQAEKEWQGSKTELQEELDKARAETRSLTNLRAEHSRLKDDFRSLFVANEKLKAEYKGIQGDYKTLRSDHNGLKLKHTQLQGETAEARHQVTNLDVEMGKLNNRVTILQQWNTTLEEDKRNLVNQVSILLAQYHELLSQTLEEKDHFHEETKAFSDKLNNLKRQKEILEDKIMEQYRRMENSSALSGSGGSSGLRGKGGAKASIGALFVRKMRRASSELISRVPRSRSRNRVGDSPGADSPDHLQDGCHLQGDTFSLESGSQHSGGSNSGCGSLDGGNHSGGEGDGTTTTTAINSTVSTPLATPVHSSAGGGFRTSLPSIITPNNSNVLSSYPERISPIRHHSFSTEALLSNRSSPTRSVLALNGLNSSNGNHNLSPPDADSSTQNSATSTTGTTNANNLLNSSFNLTSAAPYMMMAPANISFTPGTPKPIQPLPRINGLGAGLNGSNNNSIPSSPAGSLQRFNQSQRSLALLERAGSRTPLCMSEVDPEVQSLVLPEEEEDCGGELVPSSAAYSSPLVTPRNGSPTTTTGGNGNESIVSNGSGGSNGKCNGSSPTSTPALGGSSKKLYPHLTSTTRINVNISTANVTPLGGCSNPASPVLPPPLLERRGSLRLPPRPSPSSRITASDSSSPPLLPARSSNLQQPALPPKPSSAASTGLSAGPGDPNPADNGNDVSSTAATNSIWYEYGCV